MRAVILATTAPGRGSEVVEAVEGDDRFTRAFATFGPFEAVFEVRAKDHDDLLEAVAAVNGVEALLASETLLDMQVEEERSAPAPLRGKGEARALALIMENKSQGCHYAHTLFVEIRKAEGAVVEDAYPLLGRYDDAVWLRARDLDAMARATRSLAGLEGIREMLTMIEAPNGG